MQPTETKKTSIIVILVVILILIILALGLFASKVSKTSIKTTDENMGDTRTMMSSADAIPPAETLQPVTNTADDVQSLQDDLDTSATGLDSQNF